MRYKEIVKDQGANFYTAKSLAIELHQNLEDLMHIMSSGSKTAAANPHNVASLKKDIQQLYQEIMNLGYEYDANRPQYIRPLTINL
jgi:hypothetical protein